MEFPASSWIPDGCVLLAGNPGSLSMRESVPPTRGISNTTRCRRPRNCPLPERQALSVAISEYGDAHHRQADSARGPSSNQFPDTLLVTVDCGVPFCDRLKMTHRQTSIVVDGETRQ